MRKPKQSQTSVRSVLKSVWAFTTIRYTLFLALCLWGTVVQMSYRVPGRFLYLIPLIGVVLSALGFIFLINDLLMGVPDHPFRKTLGGMERVANLLIQAFVCYSLFLYLNGKLDNSRPVEHPSEILSISGGEINIGPTIPYMWASLRSWEKPGRTERLLLRRGEQHALWGGEVVLVQIHPGYFGVPWISELVQDEEKYDREMIKLVPNSSTAWKRLIDFYLDRQKWNEAGKAAWNYLKIYPNDHDLALNVGSSLDLSGRHYEGISFLDYVATRHPTYETYQILGSALNDSGEKNRAAAILKSSIPLNPENWEAYYHLGYIYSDLGNYKEAAEMFEKVMERQPRFPEVQAQLTGLWKKISAGKPVRQAGEDRKNTRDPDQVTLRGKKAEYFPPN
jgi:tetratricopeptide (TPR) repeat protein